MEELINTWKNYAAECHQRILQCKVNEARCKNLSCEIELYLHENEKAFSYQ